MDDLHRDALKIYNKAMETLPFFKRIILILAIFSNPYFIVDVLKETGEYNICIKCCRYFKEGIRKQKTGNYICFDCDSYINKKRRKR